MRVAVVGLKVLAASSMQVLAAKVSSGFVQNDNKNAQQGTLHLGKRSGRHRDR